VRHWDESVNDSTLLDRCCEGDRAAWRELFEKHAAAVYRWALFFGLDPSFAEELSQEVFVTAFRNIGEVLSERQLAPWLFQITRRKAANARRLGWVKRIVRARDVAGRDMEEISDASASARDLECSRDVRAALCRMPLSLVEVLVLHDLEGRSRAEVAAALGLSEGGVARRLASARALFAELWEVE
jgi:RNA polymerase sigma factor (sigma-70 family)